MGSRPSEKRYRPRRDSGFNSFLPTLTLGGEGFLEDFSVFSGWYLFSQTPDSEICVVSPQVFGCNCRLVYSIESKTEVSPRHVVSACSNQGLGACTLRLATVHFKRFHLTGSLQGFLGWEQESPQGFWGGNPQRTVPDGPQ